MLVAGLVAAVVSCAPPAEEGPRPLFAALLSEPATLNFVAANDGSTRLIGRLVCETLVAFDDHLEVVPVLAESWDAAPDGRTVTFHLKKDVRWHDGTPFTARDVAFTLEKVLDPAALAGSKRSYFETVTAFSVLDDHTLRVERSEPYARAVEVWEGLPILPRHLYEGRDFLEAPVNREPVGTGPYRFSRWLAGDRIELVASDDYHGMEPGIARLVFRPLTEAGTRVEALLAGELDLTQIRPADRTRIAADPDLAARVRIIEQDTLFVRYIGWNQDGSNPFFGDRRVRQAMTLALDRRGYVEHVLEGSGRVATSLVHPTMWAFDPGIEPWPYDREKAAALLDAAGWIDRDGDGLRDRDGVPFSFTLIVPAGSLESERIATLLQESLRTLGVEVNLRNLEFNIYRAERTERRFHAFVGAFRLDPDPDCYDFWHSSQIGGDGLNYAAYSNDEVDTLCDAARRVVERTERRRAYVRVQRILHRDQPFTFVAYRGSLIGISHRLQGVRTSPLGMFNWYPGALLWRLEDDPAAAGREPDSR